MDRTVREGTVKTVSGGRVAVKVERLPGCVSCTQAGKCHSPGAAPAMVEVEASGEVFKPGDHVAVTIRKGGIGTALILAFAAPLAVTVAVAALAKHWGAGDTAAAIAALCTLPPYYAVLAAARRAVGKKVEMEIRHTNDNL